MVDYFALTPGDKAMYSACCLCRKTASKQFKLTEAVILLHREGSSVEEMINIADMYGADHATQEEVRRLQQMRVWMPELDDKVRTEHAS